MFDCVIPAAGQGKRMECAGNKILLEINEKPILEYTIEVFEENKLCRNIYIAAHKDDIEEITEMTKKYTKVRPIIEGGSERQYSIYNALKQIKHCNIVMVHDAARPFVTQDTINRLYEATMKEHAAIAAVKVKDTIKAVEGDIVLGTMKRESLYAVQTPQAFKYSLLMEAYESAMNEKFLGTDDASLVERINKHVHIVLSDYDNIKLTTPEDMYFAEAILKKRGIICLG